MKSYINPTNETDIESIRKSGYDPVIEDIRSSHISRGHTVVNVREHH